MTVLIVRVIYVGEYSNCEYKNCGNFDLAGKLSCHQPDKEIPTVPCFIFPLKWFPEKVHLANILCQISYRVPFVAHLCKVMQTDLSCYPKQCPFALGR